MTQKINFGAIAEIFPLDHANRSQTAIKLAFYCAALLGLVYLILKSVLASTPTTDFKYLWLAGDLWRDGVSPYTDEFGVRGHAYFPNQNQATSFAYPPNWWLISVALSLLPHDVGAWLWRSLSAGFAISSAVIGWKAVSPNSKLLAPPFLAGFAYLCLMSAMPMGLALGQTSLLMLLGATFVLYGALRTDNQLLVAGIVILMLKPLIGAPIAAYFAIQQGGWKPVGAAAAITLAIIAPALASANPVQLVTGFLAQLHTYSEVTVNFAPAMTGLRNLVFLATGVDLSTMGFVVLCIFCCAALGFFTRFKIAPGAPAAHATYVMLLLATVLFLVPLHTYDLVLAAPFVPFSFIMRKASARWLIWGGLLLIFRANNLAALTGLYWAGVSSYFVGGSVATAGLSLIFAAMLLEARQPMNAAAQKKRPLAGPF